MSVTRESPPGVDDLTRLPRLALLAFAARCARRAQRLYACAWRNAPEEATVALERAIQAVESVGNGASVTCEIDLACRDAAIPFRAVIAALATNPPDGAAAAYFASHPRDIATALAAARAAIATARAPATALGYVAADAAASCFAAMASAASSAAGAAADAAADAARPASSVAETAAVAVAAAAAVGELITRMWLDFDHLRDRAEGETWTDQTPVPPSFFGPL